MADSVEQSQSRRKALAAALALFGIVEGMPGVEVFLRLLAGISQAVIWGGVLVLVVTPWLLATLWKTFTEAASDTLSRFFATLILLVVMFLCYLARKFHQCLYGFTEIFLGLVGCWIGLGKTTANQYDQYAGGLAVLGGIYLGVRGFINIFEGWPKAKQRTSTPPPPPEDAPLRPKPPQPPTVEVTGKRSDSPYIHPRMDIVTEPPVAPSTGKVKEKSNDPLKSLKYISPFTPPEIWIENETKKIFYTDWDGALVFTFHFAPQQPGASGLRPLGQPNANGIRTVVLDRGADQGAHHIILPTRSPAHQAAWVRLARERVIEYLRAIPYDVTDSETSDKA